MKLSDFMENYNGDIAVYQRQFASADDSVENLLINDTDLNPKSVANNNNNKSKKNNNSKSDDGVVDEQVVKLDEALPKASSSSASPPRKRHSDEENLESSDTLAPLPKTAATKRTLPSKFETPSSSSASFSKAGIPETPAGASRAPLTACTPANARAPRRSEFENPNLGSKLVWHQESESGSPLAQDLSEMGTPELKKIQAQIDRMMKMKMKN